MRKFFLLLALSLALFNQNAVGAVLPSIAEVQTNVGTITIQLNLAKAPISSANFINYTKNGFYKNTIIHRAVKDFVIQGGGVDKLTGKFKTTVAPIKNESNNGLSNVKGSVAMARLSSSKDAADPLGANTATSQFFINLVDNKFLNYNYDPKNPAGYAVFGKVVKGMDVVDRINKLVSYNDMPYTVAAELISIDNIYLSTRINPQVSVTRITINGVGKVISVPSGINCGVSCALSKPIGTAVRVTAIPTAGYYFSGWRGDCQGISKTLLINTQKGNHNCTALFAKTVSSVQ